MDSESKEHRHMVEEIVVTPFFKRHRGHMPATIKLKADISEVGQDVVLESSVKGYGKEDVKVSASANSIDVDLVLERKDSAEVKFHNSYFTPKPIDPSKLKIELKDGLLRVTAPKR